MTDVSLPGTIGMKPGFPILHRLLVKHARYSVVILVLAFCFGKAGYSQTSKDTAAQVQINMIEKWNAHFQFTGISQSHTAFSAKYSGANSLANHPEKALSTTATLFLGVQLWKGAALYFDPEMGGGTGFDSSRGIAGFPNGEIYRVSDATPVIYAARLYLRQTIALSEDSVYAPSSQNQLGELLSTSRLAITIGKFSLADMFDANQYSHDPRNQFINWSIMAMGAWDYAADTRGYTWGIAAELFQPAWEARVAAVAVPLSANGPILDKNIGKAYSLNAEFVKSYNLTGQQGRVHLVGFLNKANMGSYAESLSLSPISPDITQTRSYDRIKYGFGINIEQPITDNIGAFGRYSWDDGATETWAFTEIDRSLLLGLSFSGNLWRRKDDHLGIAYVINSLVDLHRDYLAAGGYGFIIGDGALNYGPEQILEGYYIAKLIDFVTFTIDDQVTLNPAYNKDRSGPVNIFSVRGHIEF